MLVHSNDTSYHGMFRISSVVQAYRRLLASSYRTPRCKELAAPKAIATFLHVFSANPCVNAPRPEVGTSPVVYAVGALVYMMNCLIESKNTLGPPVDDAVNEIADLLEKYGRSPGEHTLTHRNAITTVKRMRKAKGWNRHVIRRAFDLWKGNDSMAGNGSIPRSALPFEDDRIAGEKQSSLEEVKVFLAHAPGSRLQFHS